jgi:hypothetical protein
MQEMTKLRLREFLALLLFGCASLFLLYDLSHAVIYREVQVPLPRFHTWIAFDDHPILFLSSIGVVLLYLVVLGWLLNWMIKGIKAERDYFRRRDTRPPIDDSIRENFDQIP